MREHVRLSRRRPNARPIMITPAFGVLVTAAMLAKLADYLLLFAVPIAVFEETRSTGTAVATFAFRGLAYVASPVLGALIDRYDRRLMFVCSQLQQAACILLAAIWIDNRWLLAGALALSGLGGVVSTITGLFVLIPAVTAEPDRERAIARFSVAIELTKVVSYVIAGSLVALSGSRVAMIATATFYALAGVVGLLLPAVAAHAAERRRSLIAQITDGFQWLRKSSGGVALVLTMTLANLGVGAVDTVTVATLTERGLSAGFTGIVMAGGLVLGALGAGLGSSWFGARGAARQILSWQALAFIGLLLVAMPWVAFKVAGYGMVSFCLGASNVASINYRQGLIPDQLSGRVNSVIRMFITGALPLSGFIFAWADAALPTNAVWLPGIGLVIASLVVWVMFVRRVDRAVI